MIKTICALLCSAVVSVVCVKTASARDNLPIGYTAITGIKAGLWVAEEIVEGQRRVFWVRCGGGCDGKWGWGGIEWETLFTGSRKGECFT